MPDQADLPAPVEPEDEPQGETLAGTTGEPGPAESSEETLYLTIVGDQIVMQRGPAGQRASRLLASGTGASSAPAGAAAAASSPGLPGRATGASGGVSDAPVSSSAMPTTATPAQASAGTLPGTAGVEAKPEDLREFTREPPIAACPWTLPAGSTQATADLLQAQFGCRYLSSCSAPTGECSWHFQGTG